MMIFFATFLVVALTASTEEKCSKADQKCREQCCPGATTACPAKCTNRLGAFSDENPDPKGKWACCRTKPRLDWDMRPSTKKEIVRWGSCVAKLKLPAPSYKPKNGNDKPSYNPNGSEQEKNPGNKGKGYDQPNGHDRDIVEAYDDKDRAMVACEENANCGGLEILFLKPSSGMCKADPLECRTYSLCSLDGFNKNDKTRIHMTLHRNDNSPEALGVFDVPLSPTNTAESDDDGGWWPWLATAAQLGLPAHEHRTCESLPGYRHSPGDSLRVIVEGECAMWTCQDTGSYDTSECHILAKENDDCVIGGQVLKSSESLPLIYGKGGCVAAKCINGELDYEQCGSDTLEPTNAPTSSCLYRGVLIENGDRKPVIDHNGICVDAVCLDDVVMYTSDGCVHSNVNCTLPNYANINDGESAEVQGINGVCGAFSCTKGVLDVKPCVLELEPPEGPMSDESLVNSFRKVGSLMDRLGNYLTHEGFRR